ncbi:hypothetical protein MOQ72_29240 [Saccharopolyspora sp. K220]|uniref:hypothetical protein n=1 Tax=Saccharopolyspora soli TaxID=2926618 RepID=UPI001F5AB6C8|nr:hypothetical protein [Saccharopolyspora soli]MCI2421527.1 hypothetical protein [Saccharopolyspora soli]
MVLGLARKFLCELASAAPRPRHASSERLPPGGWPDGGVITVLCGEKVHVDNSPLAWLWETCPGCNVEAHALAGVPMAGAR